MKSVFGISVNLEHAFQLNHLVEKITRTDFMFTICDFSSS